ncbi:hypothetical protein Aam_015_015 [Acidocella aminolytica 101 = DSM 11237]|uniref:Uncharacterized protein n=1 Tax=Acidocella aminolytica 101 = DSM 11237 TaxID=1120923 RepID=A0A0D6PB65_9PROT|nr:hypothetical protein Aam_015_015 [Acidocella aminolytica 101 = DSM 11237]GBQ38394.1 hypothetical protein AA11237_1783 [Acidocella aminolytica 101 = DSM 11237]
MAKLRAKCGEAQKSHGEPDSLGNPHRRQKWEHIAEAVGENTRDESRHVRPGAPAITARAAQKIIISDRLMSHTLS